MSLKNKLISVLTVAIAVFAFSTFTLAQDNKATTPSPDKEKVEKHSRGEGRGEGRHEGRGEGYGDHQGGMMMRMLHDLNLTEAQKTQVHSIFEANKPDKATMEEFETLGKAKHDGTITAAQQERLTVLRTQAQENRKSVHQQIMAILTPEQKAQLEKKKLEMKQNMHERHEQREKTPSATTEKTN